MSKYTQVVSQLETVIDFIRFASSEMTRHQLFFGHGTDNAWDDAVMLVMHAIDCVPELGPKIMHAKLITEEKEHVLALLSRRIEERLPVAYLTNHAVFCGLDFYVNETVLIPRSPMAELIEERFSPWLDASRVHNILELCTGSGCIAVALAYAFPNAHITATDISPDVLEVAAINVDSHGLEAQLSLIESDVFDSLLEQEYDLIISNPPYVSEEEMADLPLEYQSEPALALYADNEGLAIVDRILVQAKNYLSEKGILVVEVGNSAEVLKQKYPEVPFTWLEFARGGDGVFLLTSQQLRQYF